MPFSSQHDLPTTNDKPYLDLMSPNGNRTADNTAPCDGKLTRLPVFSASEVRKRCCVDSIVVIATLAIETVEVHKAFSRTCRLHIRSSAQIFRTLFGRAWRHIIFGIVRTRGSRFRSPRGRSLLILRLIIQPWILPRSKNEIYLLYTACISLLGISLDLQVSSYGYACKEP